MSEIGVFLGLAVAGVGIVIGFVWLIFTLDAIRDELRKLNKNKKGA